MADRLRRCAAHVVDPDRREHLARDHEPARGFELQWKTTLESPVRHGVSLGAGVVTSGVNIFTPLSTIAAPSNQVFAVDNDTGNLFWTRRFDGNARGGNCGVSRGNLRDVDADGEPHDSASRSGKGRRARKRVLQQRGRRAGCRRADSRPRRRRPRELPRRRRHRLRRQHQRRQRRPRQRPPPAASTIPPGQWRPSPFPTNAAAQGSWSGPVAPSGVVYAVSADGMFRTLGLVSGKDVQRPAPFVPAGARFSDLIAVNDRVYTATSGGCGGAADGVWAIDIASDTRSLVVSWKTNGGSPIGSVAFATNGTAIVAIGPGTVTAGGYANAIVALDPKTLAVTDWFRQPGCRVRCAARAVSGGWQGHRRRHDEGWAHSAARRRLSRRHESRHAAVRVGVAHWRRRNVRGAVTRDVAGARTGPRRSRGSGACCCRPRRRRPMAHAGCSFRSRARCRRAWEQPGMAPCRAGRYSASSSRTRRASSRFNPAWISQNIAAPLTPIVVNGVAFAASASVERAGRTLRAARCDR